ncbi:thiaminase II [Aureimonas sp. N4]|uniref:thiaminase II n=1 Tax=Aureimonas sp. N4 TaxID=1638165 RepID=UPI000784EA22|nr:thiaminase II [Aureimonas sp. N4]
MSDVFERLKSAAQEDWDAYVNHMFVFRMGIGALPEAAFQRYLVQDYLFLIQFARANALAIYKSRTLTDMRRAKAALSAILDVELNLHIRLSERWGLSSGDLEQAREEPATTAYTRFVLDCGASGDLLDLHTALAPCVIGYGEIGARLADSLGPAHLAGHPYREWIEEYAGPAYQEVVAAARLHLNGLAERALTERRFGELAGLFGEACRLEADFWQMSLTI